MLSQGLHWTHSLPPVEILSIALPLVFLGRPSQLRPADPRTNGNLLKDMELSITGIGVRVGGSPPTGLEKFQRKLCFQGKRKLLKS